MTMSITLLGDISRIALLGIAATAFLDVWLAGLRHAGVPTLDVALIGRWGGHLLRGRWAHASIARSEPIAGERIMGWSLHYAIGIAFAWIFIGLLGAPWLQRPTLLPALLFGLATVVAPLFVMQPAMGAGIASSRAPTPLRNVCRSTLNHGVFGIGLYLSAGWLAWLG